MELKEIRDTLLQQQAVYKREVERASASIQEMKSIIESITQEEYILASEYGVELSEINNIDYEKILVDEGYRRDVTEKLNSMLCRLQEALEENLNVSN